MPGEDEGGFGGGQTTELPVELKKWADAIKATTEAIDAVSNLLDAPVPSLSKSTTRRANR